ncbi:hypothetical protein RHGRI_024024 [Rhododendron griersonianum]|uniref:glycerophosphodiester phosphodiesterase n=1 Tax=Rhododendron griersonianum TaxID=479676 RepID=A0AAV6J705_9ERIC|nr:hypothetical protein RHGRI_024024 [Rhododendron griersonianum]
MNGARVQGGHAEAEKEEVKVEDDKVLQIRGEKSHEQKEKGTHGTVWSVATGSGKFRLPENARVDLVHPYTFQDENVFLHFDFHQDPYNEYEYWVNKMGVDGLFTDFTGRLHQFQEWNSPFSRKDDDASTLLHEIARLISKYGKK